MTLPEPNYVMLQFNNGTSLLYPICQEQNLSNKRFVSDSNVNGINDGSYTAVALFICCFKKFGGCGKSPDVIAKLKLRKRFQ